MARGYGVGALASIALSVAFALIIYGLGFITFDPWSILWWLFGPLGAYTLGYALMARRDSSYYLIWGVILLAVATASVTYRILNPVVVFGILLLIIALIALTRFPGR